MNFVTTLFLLCFVVQQLRAECEKKSDDLFRCSSFNKIKNSMDHPEYKNVEVWNDKKRSLVSIQENVFKHIPNVQKLAFINVIKDIETNAFKGLNKLGQLHLFNNDLPEIKSGMFSSIPIHELLLYTSNIKKLQPRSFDNLQKLRSIYIHKNSISHIPKGVFSYTTIENLYLNENGIDTIEEEAFFGMKNLKKLALERNHLTSFEPRLYVGNTSPDLTLFWLARNNLTRMNKDSYTMFPNMKVMLMHINNIETIEEGTFNGLERLRYLDISNNKLEKLPHKVFPWEGLEYMDILFLQNNHLNYLSTDVISKLPRLKKITIGGNPWQCSCYEELRKFLVHKSINILCDEEYFEGKRPVCINPKKRPDYCQYNTDEAEELYESFETAKMDYIKLPPLCKVYCDNGSCYSHDFDVLEYS